LRKQPRTRPSTKTSRSRLRFSEILEGSRADVTLRIYGKELPVLMELLDKSSFHPGERPRGEEVEMDALTALRKSPVLEARGRTMRPLPAMG